MAEGGSVSLPGQCRNTDITQHSAETYINTFIHPSMHHCQRGSLSKAAKAKGNQTRVHLHFKVLRLHPDGCNAK